MIDIRLLLIVVPLILAALFFWWSTDNLSQYNRMRALYCGEPGDEHYEELWRERKKKSRKLAFCGFSLFFAAVVMMTVAWCAVVDLMIRPAAPKRIDRMVE